MSNRANRAAQFNPFDSLKGLQEALREKEENYSRVEKRGLSEEQQNELSKELNKLSRRDTVTVTYFNRGHYLSVTGVVVDVNIPYQYLTIGQVKIFFDDIYELKIN